MRKGALAILVHGGTENWSPARWKAPVRRGLRRPPRAAAPRRGFDPAEVHYAAVWKPKPGELAGFPNLRVIFNLGAGVDALMADRSLPGVPLVRVAVADLTDRMAEYVVLHVLMHHRREPYLAGVATGETVGAGIPACGERGVGRHHGAGHARAPTPPTSCGGSAFACRAGAGQPKKVEGVTCFHGADGFDAFLRQTDILVCLLPLTSDTRHILNRAVFAKLSRSGPLGAPVLINAGRGGLQNEADILACLADGTLGAASLDVFETEPLPADSPFWSHPKVVLTPHNAADTDPDEISKYVARQIAQFEAGGALENVVDRGRGY